MNDDKQKQSVTPAVGGEPVAWQWRTYYNGVWGSWLSMDLPIEDFREANRFNRDYELRPLYAAPPDSPLRGVKPQAMAALNHYRQADEDGVMVNVSRQALDEAIAVLTASKEKRHD